MQATELDIGRTADLAEFAAELRRQREAREDFVADTRRIGFYSGQDGSAMEIDGVYEADGDEVGVSRLFPVNDHAHGQIAARVGIPKRYYDRMRGDAPALLDSNVRHWLHSKPEKRMIRVLDGRVRAFLSDRYRRMDNFELAEGAILPALSDVPGLVVKAAAISDLRMYVKVVLPSLAGEVKVGDVVCAGVEISNSEVGSGSLAVVPRLYQLVCANGLVVPREAIGGMTLRKYHVGRRVEESEENALAVFTDETLAADDRALFLKVRDVIKAALDETVFATLVGQMQDLAEERIPVVDVPAAVERLADRFDLSETEGKSILSHLIEGGDLSSWGYTSAITRSAQDVDSYDREAEIERVGGAFAMIPSREREALLVGRSS